MNTDVHEIHRTKVYPTGAEHWFCRHCGHEYVSIIRNGMYFKVVIVSGKDGDVLHQRVDAPIGVWSSGGSPANVVPDSAADTATAVQENPQNQALPFERLEVDDESLAEFKDFLDGFDTRRGGTSLNPGDNK